MSAGIGDRRRRVVPWHERRNHHRGTGQTATGRQEAGVVLHRNRSVVLPVGAAVDRDGDAAVMGEDELDFEFDDAAEQSADAARFDRRYDEPEPKLIPIVGTIQSVKRLQSSVSGNPRFAIQLVDGRLYTTQRDAGWVYAIDDSWVGKPFSLTVRNGSLLGAEPLLTE